MTSDDNRSHMHSRDGVEAGTAAISPVTPEQTAVLKIQVIKPGTRLGRRR